MSYSEENGQVVLRMSRGDWDLLLMALSFATGGAIRNGGNAQNLIALVNRLNQGNPNYTPYQVSPSPNCKSSEQPH